jgi:site-specific recombinase XerD
MKLKVKSQYLLHSKKGEKLDRKSLWRILDKGIDKQLFNNRINPDTFRENYIINRLCELQNLLGYDSFSFSDELYREKYQVYENRIIIFPGSKVKYACV